jgi:hypothetical protein
MWPVEMIQRTARHNQAFVRSVVHPPSAGFRKTALNRRELSMAPGLAIFTDHGTDDPYMELRQWRTSTGGKDPLCCQEC